MMASRGCPYSCTYCCNSALRATYSKTPPGTRRRSVGKVIEEIADVEIALAQAKLIYCGDSPDAARDFARVKRRKAARGDKDAAARIGRAYLRGEGEIQADPNRYEGWMQYAAALGNGMSAIIFLAGAFGFSASS